MNPHKQAAHIILAINLAHILSYLQCKLSLMVSLGFVGDIKNGAMNYFGSGPEGPEELFWSPRHDQRSFVRSTVYDVYVSTYYSDILANQRTPPST